MIPKTITDSLALLGELVEQKHRRCIGVLLLLDRATQQWTHRVPAQRCGRSASCWSALLRDVPQPSGDLLLAGSFQTRRLTHREEPVDAVPPCDGVHLVHVVQPDKRAIWTFLRSDGETRLVPASMVIFDDLEAALEECLPRLTFAP